MKRHVPGFFIALLTFFGSFYISPIRFDSVGAGHGFSTDGADWCDYYPHVSSYFVPLSASVCDYGTNEAAINNVNKKVSEAAEIIEPAAAAAAAVTAQLKAEGEIKTYRAIIILKENDNRYFCIIRADKEWVSDICSLSLRHVLEFEKQKFKEE